MLYHNWHSLKEAGKSRAYLCNLYYCDWHLHLYEHVRCWVCFDFTKMITCPPLLQVQYGHNVGPSECCSWYVCCNWYVQCFVCWPCNYDHLVRFMVIGTQPVSIIISTSVTTGTTTSQDIWRPWCFWRSEKPQWVINLSCKPSFLSWRFDLDEKANTDDGVPHIGKPAPACIETAFSYSAVWVVPCVSFNLLSYTPNILLRIFGRGPFQFLLLFS